jgi:O-acetyl-ADP-ribose deacetylase (regulator of RNase III)
MRYREIKGDVLKSPDEYIMHGCNCQGVMGAGVALQIARKWPKVFESYKHHCDVWNDNPDGLLGYFHAYKTNDSAHIIINAFTQLNTGSGKQVSYDAIDKVTKKLNKLIPSGKNLSMPMIGSGLAGGDWEIIRTIIQRNMTNVNVTVYEYDG